MMLRPILIGSVFLAATSLPAVAGDKAAPSTAPIDVLQAMSRCATLGDGPARLACYDDVAPRVQAALAAQPQLAGKRPPTEEEQKSWFGFDMGDLFGTSAKEQTTPQQFGADDIAAAKKPDEAPRAPAAPKQIDRISAKVSEYTFNPFGKFLVILDNGQIWKQLQGDSDLAHFRSNPADNTVTISRGFLGSYNLSVNGSSHIYKVVRIK